MAAAARLRSVPVASCPRYGIKSPPNRALISMNLKPSAVRRSSTCVVPVWNPTAMWARASKEASSASCISGSPASTTWPVSSNDGVKPELLWAMVTGTTRPSKQAQSTLISGPSRYSSTSTPLSKVTLASGSVVSRAWR